MSLDRIDDIRARLASATPGPWEPVVLGSEGYDVRGPQVQQPGRLRRRVRVARCGYEEWEVDKRNASLIAHAPEDLAWLLAKVDRLNEALDASEGEREDLDTAVGTLMGENVELKATISRARALIAEWYGDAARIVVDMGGGRAWSLQHAEQLDAALGGDRS